MSLEERLGHTFSDPGLLERALTHRSWAHENGGRDNERLEFLGDAVLETAITTLLHARFADSAEGELSRYRASLVRTGTLAEVARGLDLGGILRVGNGEEATGGRDKDSVLANAMEAVLGALYLDAGFDRCLDVVTALYADALAALEVAAAEQGAVARKDAVSRLQELTQGRWQRTPHYEVVGSRGPAHEPTFVVEVCLGDRVLARGEGGSKREANRHAASHALASLDGEAS